MKGKGFVIVILVTTLFFMNQPIAHSAPIARLTPRQNDMGTGGDAYNSYGASSSATTLSLPASGTGYIYYSSDQYDQYKVAVSAGEEITIEFTPPSGARGIDIPFYDYDGSTIKTVYNILSTHTEKVTASGNGYIYFTIDGDRTTDRGTYSLSVTGEGGDTTPPTVSIAAPSEGETLTSSDISVTWTGSDNIGIDYYEARVVGGSWINKGTATSHTFTGLADGSHSVDVRAWDAAGNSGSDTVSFSIDTSTGGPITYTFTGSLSTGQDSTRHTFSVPSGSTLVEVELQMPAGADYDLSLWDNLARRTGGWTATDRTTKNEIPNAVYSGYSANPETIDVNPPSTFGTWEVGCYAYSGSGGYTLTVIVTPPSGPDTTPPTVTITNPADGATVYTADVTVSWTGSDNIGIDYYEVCIDGGGWINKGSATSHTFIGLADGSHTADVRAWDAAGNSGSDSVTFTVDSSSNPVEQYAVIVGISDYKAISDLSYCDEDATDWYNHLTSAQMGFDYIWVYGDGHTTNFPQYDGIASEYNVKQALINMVNSADSNDIISFITSGHGSGNGIGDSYLCMWDCGSGESGEDGDMWDYELAAILDDAIADRIFVFIDHCYSGGMGPELMAMPNGGSVYVATTCTQNGYGWDSPTHQNGLWTYYYLEYSWLSHFGGSATVSMEDVFAYAHAGYPYGGGDEPQEFDGNTSSPFYLT
jgi:hypothetical protein